MEPTDLTIEILKSIRDELRGLKVGQTETNARLESLERTTNERFERLERRQTETEVRLSTALTEVVGALGDVRTLLRENYAATIRDLDRRVTALEARAEP